MGCAVCGQKAVYNQQTVQKTSLKYNIASQESCDYTTLMLNNFNEKLVWFKDKGLYVKYNIPAKTINKYIGIVLTSLNISNKCMYKPILDKVSDLVDLIITLQ